VSGAGEEGGDGFFQLPRVWARVRLVCNLVRRGKEARIVDVDDGMD
jgi:hypothetical protein